MNKIISECKSIEKKLISLRRELHKYPEYGEKLPKTREIVGGILDEIGIQYKLNKNDDGLIAEIKGAKDRKTIAFRADMDGLNIIEEIYRLNLKLMGVCMAVGTMHILRYYYLQQKS